MRSLTWHDTRFEVGKVQSSVVGDYQRVAELLRQEGLRGFFSSSSSLADLNNLGHPPGYSILIALVRAIFGSSNAAIQFTQIVFDSLAAVLLFLIVFELFSLAPATIAGLFAALSPQLVWNSVLLLPDSLATFPILLAVFLLARSREKPRLTAFVMMGALVGLSCWLRANAMLLTGFIAVAVLLLHGKKHWRYSLAVIAGTLLIVLPLTIRNAIATRHFIPVSLGAGQTLLEGIADYDTNNRFGIPNTDMGIMKQEAEVHQRPEYYGTLFNPDGVQRERARMKRGAGVIASNPVWFASVMVRRAASMTRLERTRLLSSSPAVTHSPDTANSSRLVDDTTTLMRRCSAESPQAKFTFDPANAESLILLGDASKYGDQFLCERVPLKENTDYLLELSFRIPQGRMRVSVNDTVSDVLEPLEVKQPAEQPVQTIRLPFASMAASARVDFSNEASNAPPIVHVDAMNLYELGPARYLWTRYPRLLLHLLQRVFVTAVFLPLALIGVGLTIFRKRTAALIVLAVVPVYYFTVQSAFHTEYRYVLAVNYSLFAFAAVAIGWVVRFAYRKVSSLSVWERVRVRA
ncbi:MAG TPA: glycosyltransferase family 39 protein [Pyrinomonadaceae bacterium]|nr:glycosyltransferase family 39 protein [Pyrinomonadaceae bacterium]